MYCKNKFDFFVILILCFDFELLYVKIGFCAQWFLDNLLPVEGRKFSHTCVDQTNINVILNHNDVR